MKADTVHAMAWSVNASHTSYSNLTRNTRIDQKYIGLPKKNLKTNIMDVHCILIKIVNGKQARSASSMLTRIEDNTD